ncbi:MAG: class I SAM-dependent methyltransferase [Candidatus Methanofastidiosum sp.]|nr:class I SAM-dependent methyltransferase [Methanofastidiosum sp.]
MEQERIEKYLESLSKIIRKNGILLDAGCGSGNFSIWKKINNFDNYLKIGLDLDPFDNKNLDFPVCGNLYKLPFRENLIDIIVCEMVAEHLDTPELMISEFHRILKKNGHTIIFTPNKYHPIFFLANLLPQKIVDSVKLYYYKFSERENFDVYYKFNDFSRILKISKKYFEIIELYTYYSEAGFSSDKLFLKNIYKIYKKFLFILPERMRGGLIVITLKK